MSLQQPLDQSQAGGNSGLGFGAVPGGQLISTALGMTRAVTSFLGAALKVCCCRIRSGAYFGFFVCGRTRFCHLPF